jgi:transposase
VHLIDGPLTIDNAPPEEAIRPLAIGRRNRRRLGGEKGLRPTAVVLIITGSAQRQGLNPAACTST